MVLEVISETTLKRRANWIQEIIKLSNNFGADSSRVISELDDEVEHDGTTALLDHLRLCGAIPENYGHDSSEEKLYSKYTDALLAACFRRFGLSSTVLGERADCADVEAVATDYSLVADAKVFRLSRTAKNQKDFKIEAMHSWKRGKPHAMVVCPIYQLPARASQIYLQAVARDVCILTYSHLCVLLGFAEAVGSDAVAPLLLKILRCAEALNPTKEAVAYWHIINRTMLDHHPLIRDIWQLEKRANLESIAVAKAEALSILAEEREAIMRLSRDEAIARLVRMRNLDGREAVIRRVSDSDLLSKG